MVPFAKFFIAEQPEYQSMNIVIVGGFGTETRQMENTLAQAVRELGIRVSIGVAAGIREMAAYDIHRMPGLVIDGKVIYDGEVPDVEELKKVLLKYSKKTGSKKSDRKKPAARATPKTKPKKSKLRA